MTVVFAGEKNLVFTFQMTTICGMYPKAQMYRCTRHGSFMVIVRQGFENGVLVYYKCPVWGCGQVKPCKWSPRLQKSARRREGVFTNG